MLYDTFIVCVVQKICTVCTVLTVQDVSQRYVGCVAAHTPLLHTHAHTHKHTHTLTHTYVQDKAVKFCNC